VPSTPEQASAAGKIGALVVQARYGPDAVASRARSGIMARYRAKVLAENPQLDGDDAEIQRRALLLRRAHMQRLAWKSAKARQAKAEAVSQVSAGEGP